MRYEILAAMSVRDLSAGCDAVFTCISVPNSYRDLLLSYVVAQLDETLRSKPNGAIRIFHYLNPGVDSDTKRNEYQGISLATNAAGE